MNKYCRVTLYALVTFVVFGLSGCKDKNRVVEPHDGPAHILLKETEYNFGQLDGSRSVVSHEFQLINDGGEPLVINDIENFCHCTHVEYPKEPIRPGHAVTLMFYLNADDVSGYFIRDVIVHTNAGDARIQVKGERI
jgi:hypothetical protein